MTPPLGRILLSCSEADLRPYSLTRIFNALPFPDLQQTYREWAALEFPDKWQKIQKLRMTKTLDGTDRILIPPERVQAD